MPIRELDTVANTIAQTCSNCGRDHVHDLTKLTLGTDRGGEPNPDAIILPACACGSEETIMRTWDKAPDLIRATPFASHRRMVNSIATHLVGLGREHTKAKRTGTPEDVLDERDHGGATLMKIAIEPKTAARRGARKREKTKP